MGALMMRSGRHYSRYLALQTGFADSANKHDHDVSA